MTQNLNNLDRILRFALAFWWLGPWAPEYSSSLANLFLAIIGWVALIESFIGWCGLHRLLGLNKKNQ